MHKIGMNCSDTWLPQGVFQPQRYRPGNIANWSGHLPFAHDLVASVRPELIVELGTHYGESYFGFCQAVSENNLACRCYAVDSWQGELHAGFYDESVYRDVSEYNEEHYRSISFLLRMSFDEARKSFSNESIDILHIDGLHTYGSVSHDFENWISAVKPGGIVLLHDTSARHADFGVWKLWNDLEGQGERFDFSHSWGLGVFRKRGGDSNHPLLAAMFSGGESRRNHIRKFYSLCGRSLEYGHLHAATQDRASTTALIQIYPEKEGGFSSKAVYNAVFKTKDWEHIRVDLVSGTLKGKVRLDITECIGVIDISGVSVSRAVDGEAVFRARGAEELASIAVGGTMIKLPIQESTEFCRYISHGSDPQIFLDLNPNVSDQPLILDLWVRVDSDVTILLPWLTRQPVNLANSDDESLREEQIEHTEQQLRDTQQRLSQLEADLAARRAEALASADEIAQLTKESDADRKDRDSLKALYRKSQGEVYVLKRDLESASENSALVNENREKLQIELRAVSDSQALLSAEHNRLRVMHDEVSSQYQALEQLQANLELTFQGVLSSRSWKITKPLRRFAELLRNGKH